MFVHCRRGDDRAGMDFGCYRIVHDHWTNEQAVAEAREHAISRFEVLMRRYLKDFDASRTEAPATH